MPQRPVLLTIFLATTLAFVVAKTYLLWSGESWELPQAPKVSSPEKSSRPAPPLAAQPPMAAADFIIAKNLFDPERGATLSKEAEANSRAMQRLKSLVLLGTAILGEGRYAIVQDSGAQPAGRPAQGQPSQTMRFRVGDTFEGFRLSQIQDKNIVFTNGSSRVELGLDYFRKVEPSTPSAAPAVQGRPQPTVAARPGTTPTPVAPRVMPQLPRRERLPLPPTS